MLINSTTLKSLDLVDGSKLTFDLATTKKEDVCITTPLFVSEYKNGINLGLVRMLNNNTNVGFGKGTNLNVCYKLAKTNDTTLVLTHPTFEQEQFVLDDDTNTFKSTISDRYVTKQEESEMYTLYNGNTSFVFDLTNNTIAFISELHNEALILYFDYDNNNKLIKVYNNNDLKEIAFLYYDETTNNCISVLYRKKLNSNSDILTEIGEVKLTYSNDIISKFRVFNHSTTSPQITRQFTMNGQQMFVYDERTTLYNTIKLIQSSTGKHYVGEIDVSNQKLFVTYDSGYKTTLKYVFNKKVNGTKKDVEVNKEEYFFNKNYELSFVKANDRIVKAFNYELNEKHKLLSVSNELFVEPELNGEFLLHSSYMQTNNSSVTVTTDTTCPASSSISELNIKNSAQGNEKIPAISLIYNKTGTKLDVLTVLVWYKIKTLPSTANGKVYASLSLSDTNGVKLKSTIYNTQTINTDNLDDWNFMTLSIQSAEDFNKVQLNFNTNCTVKLNAYAALFINSFTSIYRYDKEGKIDATLKDKTCNYYKFNQNNQALLSKNTVNSYDEKGRVIQSVSPKKVVSSATYDNKGNVTSQKVHKVNETGFMGKQFAYVDGELLSQITNEDLTTQAFGYDSYKRQNSSQFGNLDQNITFVPDDSVKYGLVQSAELKEGNNIQGKLSYEYDYYLNLSKASSTNDDVDKTTIKYAYDSNKRVTKVSNYYKTYTPSTGNGTQDPDIGPGMSIIPGVEENEIENKLYECTYDDMGNIKSYNYGDSSKNVSYEYEETDRTTLNNVKKIKYCNEDKYEFEYSNDDKGLLSKVTSHDTIAANGEELSTNYEYDNNQIKTIKIKGGSATYHTNELKYNQNNEAFIERNITGESVLETEYLDSSKIAFDSINGFEYSLLCEQDDDLYWTMFIDRKYKRYDIEELIDCSYILLNSKGNNVPCSTYSTNYDDQGIRFKKFNVPENASYYDLSYDFSDNLLGENYGVLFPFMLDQFSENSEIINIWNSSTYQMIVYLKNNKVYCRIQTHDLYSEENSVVIPITNLIGQLHTMAINVTRITTSNSFYNYKMDIYVDGQFKTSINDTNMPQMRYISFFKNERNPLNGKIGCVILNTSKHLSEDKIKEYTNRLKAIYNKGESYPENFNITLDHYENYDYDTIALHNTFESKNGLKPSEQLNNPGIVNIQDNFEFVDDEIDTNVGNYVYAMKNQTLKYNIPLSNSGMIGVRFKTITNKSATFLHLQSENGFSFVVTTFNNKILSRFRGTQIYAQEISNDWNSAIITWSKQIQSASLDEGSCQIKIYINGSLIYSSSFMSYYSIVPEMSLGKNLADTSTANETIGYIDKVIYNDQFISDVTAANLHNEMSNHYYLKDTCDDFGRKTSRKVKTRSNSKLENIYEYKENLSSNISTKTNILNKETLKIDNIEKENRRYTYDSLGNVNNITITDNFHSSTISTSYTYGKGQITKEFVAVYPGSYTGTIEYSYDGRGNITSIKRNGSTTKTFEYSKNGLLLTKVNTTQIEYDGLFPKYVKDENGNTIKELEFEGRRLKSLIDYVANKKYCYFYNASGLREQKKVYNKTTNVLLSSVDYYYNSRNLLVSEVRKTYSSGTLSTTYDIMYMYDSNGMLYAFKYNGDVFYYVRDALGNINYIVNQDGELESSYTYEAYGSHTVLNAQGSTSTSSTLIGNINPFRYKEYYYDVETQLYWVSSRYYSPELCRWISPDSIEYLDPESINGLNLYAYCGNDPINKYDPTGHWGVWALVAITVASMIIGGTAQFVSNAMAGKTGSELWRGVAGAAVGAGVNALALCLAMPTGGASLFIAAGASAIAQTGVDTLETVIRGEEVDVGQTFIDLGLNFVTTLAGNYLGGKMVPTNRGWIQTQRFWSVFTKPYGQKILLQTAIGAGLSGTVNFIRKNDWSKYKPIILLPVVPLYPLF